MFILRLKEGKQKNKLMKKKKERKKVDNTKSVNENSRQNKDKC